MAPPINPTYQPSFDPTSQNMTYLDYINQMTGYGQPPQNSFPAETNNLVAPPPPPKPNYPAQGAQAYGTYQAGNQISQMIPSVPSSTPVSGAPATSVGAPLSQTEAVTQGGDVATQSTPLVGGSSPVAGAEPGILGSIQAAPAYIPAAVVASTAMGVNSARDSYKQGQQNGVMGGIKSGFDSPMDAGTAFATGGLSIPANLAAGVWGGLQSGKGKDQRGRDVVRKEGQNSKWFDENFQVPLSDTTLDLGKDGGFKYGEGTPGERPVYNVDFDNDPLAAQGVGWTKPLAAVLAKGDRKLTDDFTAQFYNEITADGKITDLDTLRKRTVELYNHFQLKPSIVAGAVSQMGFDEGETNAMLASIDSLRLGGGPQIAPGIDPNRPSVTAMGTGATGNKGTRISPGVYKDSQGEYQSKDGVRR